MEQRRTKAEKERNIYTAVAQWCGALNFESGDSKLESHCSQHVVVTLGETLHPKLLLWGMPIECMSLWIKTSNT